MNKKNYIKPIATVFACNTESLLAGSTGVESNVNNRVEQPKDNGSTGDSNLFGSKSNSGLLDWDDGEE